MDKSECWTCHKEYIVANSNSPIDPEFFCCVECYNTKIDQTVDLIKRVRNAGRYNS